ncbi:MAG: hypothetical protein KC620_16560, partial [Myxococcales bacterium]|nr:hypothetical protein [Myxococcales bacterium]
MTRAAVATLFAVGAALVVRAGRIYHGQDTLALLVVGLIGLVLVLGAAELWLRAGSARALRREVDALPRPLTDEAVTGASGRL